MTNRFGMDDFTGILVEAEAFDNYGGWTLDSQYELEMGSPYLLAHGLGRPVADATTTVTFPKMSKYHVYVRTKDWVPKYHPGRFTLSFNNMIVGQFGGSGKEEWCWEYGGTVKINKNQKVLITLHDLTGFDGRCDAIYFGLEKKEPPSQPDESMRLWRKHLLGLPKEPVHGGEFDVIVVGGGVVGSAAAITAARLGDRVALVHNRPVLGGNGSVECGLRPRGVKGPLIEEIADRHPNGDLKALSLLDIEQNATLFMEYTVYNVISEDSKVVALDARHARTGEEVRLSAPVFIDCSGKVAIGLQCGAETLFGQESRSDFGESLAPQERNEEHHGNTLFFRTRMADHSVGFPSDLPWATEISKDYANLSGQLIRAGLDNGEGPSIGEPDPKTPRRMRLPITHGWEYGQFLDPYKQGEEIRDHLLRAILGTFSNVKKLEPEKYANLELDHLAFVPATGEYKRYKGDHVLTEVDIRNHKPFRDAVVQNGSAFCLHYPHHEKYDFRLRDWRWDERDEKDYDIPFRCLYSTNISNLMMAGKHISVTHVAGSSTKFMGNGGQHAIATAAAAHLCKKYDATPKEICERHMPELQRIATSITGTNCSKRRSHL